VPGRNGLLLNKRVIMLACISAAGLSGFEIQIS
jgi:hypothetical protein